MPLLNNNFMFPGELAQIFVFLASLLREKRALFREKGGGKVGGFYLFL